MSTKEKILEWLEDEESYSLPHKEEPRKSYEKKVVAWVDILGIREKIRNEKEYDAERIISIMSSLAVYVKEACKKYMNGGDFTLLQIADGFMIVVEETYINNLCKILATIQWRILFELKMLARGAITIGNVSVTNGGELIIGPAYVEAYAMESENAIYSRVIMSDELYKLIKNNCEIKFVKKDFDNVYYIDYMDYMMAEFNFDNLKIRKMLIEQGVRDEIKRNYDSEKLKVKQKYGWTIQLLSNKGINII